MMESKKIYCVQNDAAKVVSAGETASVCVFDIMSGQLVMELKAAHKQPIMCLQYDGYFNLVTGSYDKVVKVWDMRKTVQPLVLEGHSDAVFNVSFDDRRVISGSADKSVKVWNFRETITTY